MKNRVVRCLLLALVLFAAGSAVVQASRPDRPAIDPQRDPRLTQRVRVRAEGIPVRWILQALAEKTAVRLDVAGTAGDERLVAFVPEAPLAEVMERIADLYRLTWTHEQRGSRHRYRLQKPVRLATEERTLREQAFRQLMERLAAQLRTPQEPDGGAGHADEPGSWSSVFPLLAPLIQARAAVLLREGYLYLPVASLPGAEREPFAARLQPALEAHHRFTKAFAEHIRQQRLAEGKEPVYLAGEESPASARTCTLLVELHVDQELRASVGLKTGAGHTHYWVHATGEGTLEKALELYRDRRPDIPEMAEGRTPREAALDVDRWTRPVELARDQDARPGDWIGTLRRLSDAAGIAIYADCYQDLREGPERHPRGDFKLSGRVVPLDALGALCYPLAKRGEERLSANSFWWRRGDSALVRSRRWLWESAGVLPADLINRLIRSLRATGQLSPSELPAIASLSPFQVQSAGYLDGHLDTWHEAVRVPAGLSPGARSMLLTQGITWEKLGPGDRRALVHGYPSAAGVPRDRYAARLESSVESIPCQGGTLLRLRFEAAGAVCAEASALYFPLPGVTAGKGLPPHGLRIEVPGEPGSARVPSARSGDE
jgi:hypothetical protein